ncbi:MAG: XdhC family protein [Methylococcaceae bacterium]|nr:XdhC family protein [Methylococcaceae bacterium]
MDGSDTQVLAAVQRWALDGYRFALVTVARTWGSAPRLPGAWMALREDGLVQGSVSGGCVEDDLIRRMNAGELAGERPFRLDYGVTREEAQRFGLPCGGRMELVVEPAPEPALLAELQHRIASGQLVQRIVDLVSGMVRLTAGSSAAALRWDGNTLVSQHGPRWRLLIIGAGEISRYLAQMAQSLDYAVTVCDPRKQYSREWDVAGAPWLAGFPDDVVLAMEPDARTAIVALTHDPKLDDMALLEALKSPAFYVGALGSAANNAKRRERLLQYFDLTAEQVERLHGPVGLPIGSRTPPEIAVSILAEMTAVKRGCGSAGTGIWYGQSRSKVSACAGA